ncbi:Uncharacterised protein [Klebsiella pneumoniae]|nr:Uncharacterised protein [Klebsiella pneumoniae]
MLAGVAQATVLQARAGEAHAAHPAVLVKQYPFRSGPGQQAHLAGLGDLLLVAGGAHFLEATAVDQVDVAGAEPAHLHRHVDGGVAGADDDATVGDGQVEQVVALPQLADVVGGGEQAGGVLVFQAEALAGGQADAEEHRVVLVVQGAERQVVAETLAVAQFDTADLQEEFHFAPGEVVHQLVAGDAVLVEAAGLGAGLEEHHVVAVHGQAVGAGQPGRPGADHGDALAGGRRALERMFAEAGVVEGVALQLADQHRCAFLGVVAYAGPLAEDFRGADAGAAAAEDVRREDLLRRALDILLGDAADEPGDVDLGRAGVDAGRVVAVQAAGAFQGGLAGVERRREVGEALGERVRAGVRTGEVVQGIDHGCSLSSGFFSGQSTAIRHRPASTGRSGIAGRISARRRPGAGVRRGGRALRTPTGRPGAPRSVRRRVRRAGRLRPRAACPG